MNIWDENFRNFLALFFGNVLCFLTCKNCLFFAFLRLLRRKFLWGTAIGNCSFESSVAIAIVSSIRLVFHWWSGLLFFALIFLLDGRWIFPFRGSNCFFLNNWLGRDSLFWWSFDGLLHFCNRNLHRLHQDIVLIIFCWDVGTAPNSIIYNPSIWSYGSLLQFFVVFSWSHQSCPIFCCMGLLCNCFLYWILYCDLRRRWVFYGSCEEIIKKCLIVIFRCRTLIGRRDIIFCLFFVFRLSGWCSCRRKASIPGVFPFFLGH